MDGAVNIIIVNLGVYYQELQVGHAGVLQLKESVPMRWQTIILIDLGMTTGNVAMAAQEIGG